MAEEKKKRGRPRKTPIEEKPEVLSEQPKPLQMDEKSVTPKQVTMGDVQRSLTSLYESALNKGSFDGFNLNRYNPFLQNNRLKMISTLPAKYTPEEITKFLEQPQVHELGLRGASQALSATQYLYYKILREAADVPLYKYYVIPECLEEKDYTKDDFVKEEEFVDKWLGKFDIPNTFKRIALETKREGKTTYVFRQSLETVKGKVEPCYVTLQKLPTEFTKLTAIGEHGYIASFNLLVFLNPAFSPLQYPEFIRDIWNDLLEQKVVYKEEGYKRYNVDFNGLRKYTYKVGSETVKGTIEAAENAYMYWVQLPQDLCFTFASDSSHPWVVPDTMGLFTALQELTDYSTLAGLVASTPLTAILTGEAEAAAQPQPGQDQTVLSPHTMLSFQNAFNSMVSTNIQAFLAPFKNLKLQSLPSVPNASDIKTKAVQNFISTAGEGGLITATDKPSVAMVKGAQLLAASQADFVTRQFQTVVNVLLERWTGVKYRWRVELWGDIFTFDSNVKIMKEMVMSGATFVLPKLASAFNMTMRDVRGLNAYLSAHKVYDGFKTLGWAQTQQRMQTGTSTDKTGGEIQANPVGRPVIDDGDVENDSTAASKDAGDNISELKDYAEHGICPLCGEPTEDGHILCGDCEEQIEVGGEDDED